MHEGGHFYVCGDVSMAEGVSKTVKTILEENGIDDPELALVSLRVSVNRRFLLITSFFLSRRICAIMKISSESHCEQQKLQIKGETKL